MRSLQDGKLRDAKLLNVDAAGRMNIDEGNGEGDDEDDDKFVDNGYGPTYGQFMVVKVIVGVIVGLPTERGRQVQDGNFSRRASTSSGRGLSSWRMSNLSAMC